MCLYLRIRRRRIRRIIRSCLKIEEDYLRRWSCFMKMYVFSEDVCNIKRCMFVFWEEVEKEKEEEEEVEEEEVVFMKMKLFHEDVYIFRRCVYIWE